MGSTYKQNNYILSKFRLLYSTDKSFVGSDFSLLNSPLRLKPGECVELRTYDNKLVLQQK